MMYLDLSELDTVFKRRWFWSTRRVAPARFRRQDHFGDPAMPLDRCVRDLVESRTGSRPAGPIRLLTNLSMFGYVFNPASFYYCFADGGSELDAIVVEVSNTPWRERYCYVLSVTESTAAVGSHRFRTAKELHVSPFMGMDVNYEWLVTVPGDNLVVRIANTADGERFFNATLTLKRTEISGTALASTLVRYPVMTLKVIRAIHWQALKLWLRGVPVHSHPDKVDPVKRSQ